MRFHIHVIKLSDVQLHICGSKLSVAQFHGHVIKLSNVQLHIHIFMALSIIMYMYITVMLPSFLVQSHFQVVRLAAII